VQPDATYATVTALVSESYRSQAAPTVATLSYGLNLFSLQSSHHSVLSSQGLMLEAGTGGDVASSCCVTKPAAAGCTGWHPPVGRVDDVTWLGCFRRLSAQQWPTNMPHTARHSAPSPLVLTNRPHSASYLPALLVSVQRDPWHQLSQGTAHTPPRQVHAHSLESGHMHHAGMLSLVCTVAKGTCTAAPYDQDWCRDGRCS
jgi:hypothetical protein